MATTTRFVAIDDSDKVIGIYDSRDGAAGACQDAAREANSDGEGYEVKLLSDYAAELTRRVCILVDTVRTDDVRVFVDQALRDDPAATASTISAMVRNAWEKAAQRND